MPEMRDLVALSARLSSCGLDHALGGSGLLAYLGLPVVVHDWDLTTEASLAEVKAALDGYTFAEKQATGVYRSDFLLKLTLAQSSADIIGGFAIAQAGHIIRIRTIVSGYWGPVPVGSPEEWLKAYRAMGKTNKATLLATFLQG